MAARGGSGRSVRGRRLRGEPREPGTEQPPLPGLPAVGARERDPQDARTQGLCPAAGGAAVPHEAVEPGQLRARAAAAGGVGTGVGSVNRPLVSVGCVACVWFLYCSACGKKTYWGFKNRNMFFPKRTTVKKPYTPYTPAFGRSRVAPESVVL